MVRNRSSNGCVTTGCASKVWRIEVQTMNSTRLEEATEAVSPRSTNSVGSLFGLLRQQWRPLAVAGAISVVAAGLNLAQPLIVNRIIATIGQGPVGSLVVILTALVVLTAAVEAIQQFLM